MIEYNNDLEEMCIDCDNCGNYINLDGPWQDCIDQAKDEGWRIVKNGDVWEHFCPDENNQ